MYLSGTLCVKSTNCPPKSYANNTNYKCTPCISPCSTCFNLTTCYTCVADYIYKNQNCFLCPPGQIASHNVCINCVSPCLTCKTSAFFCLKCDPSVLPILYLISTSGVCSTSCPTGTYMDLPNRACATCLTACSSCNSTSYCFTCNSGYYFYQNQFIKSYIIYKLFHFLYVANLLIFLYIFFLNL